MDPRNDDDSTHAVPPEPGTQPSPGHEPDVHRIPLDDRTLILVGTAHISGESRDQVRRVIQSEHPDLVCVELDQRRHDALLHPTRWEDLDLRHVIRSRQIAMLLVHLVLMSYQRRLGAHLGIRPGTELLEAVQTAREAGVPVELCDRDIGITLKRLWSTTTLWQRVSLLGAVFASLFDRTQIDETQLRKLRQSDVLTGLIDEMASAFPTLKSVLIDERDLYMAERLRRTRARKVVAVVGAGHVPGIRRILEEKTPADLEQLDSVRPPSRFWKIAGWAVPVVILGSIAWIGYTRGPDAAADNALFWILANGIPSAIGAAIGLLHPVTIATAFVAAPFTSLTPLIGAGYVAAFVQAWIQPPRVREMESVAEEIASLRAWTRNRMLKVFLAFLLPGLGSAIGTWIGGVEILRNLG